MWIDNKTEVNIEQFETFKEFANFCSTFNVTGIWAYLWKELKIEGSIILTRRD